MFFRKSKGEKDNEKERDKRKKKNKDSKKKNNENENDEFSTMAPPIMERLDSDGDPKGVRNKLRSGKRRLKQQVVNTVKKEGLDDQAFQQRKEKVFELRDNVKELGKRVKTFLGHCRAMTSSAAELGHFTQSIGTNDQKFANAMGILDTKVRTDLESGVIQCLDSLVLKLKPFEELERRCERRQRFVLDFDSYTRKVRALKENPKSDPNKVLDKEMKLERSADKLQKATKDLYQAFDYYDALGGKLVVPELMLLKRAQLKFFTMSMEILGTVEIVDPTEVTQQLENIARRAKSTAVPNLTFQQQSAAMAAERNQFDSPGGGTNDWDQLPIEDSESEEYEDSDDEGRSRSQNRSFELDSPSNSAGQAGEHGFVFHSATAPPPPGAPPQRQPSAERMSRGPPPFEVAGAQGGADPFAVEPPPAQNQAGSSTQWAEKTLQKQTMSKKGSGHGFFDPFASAGSPQGQQRNGFSPRSDSNQTSQDSMNMATKHSPQQQQNHHNQQQQQQSQKPKRVFAGGLAQGGGMRASFPAPSQSTNPQHQTQSADPFPQQQQQKPSTEDPFASLGPSMSSALPAQTAQNSLNSQNSFGDEPPPRSPPKPPQPQRNQLPRARAIFSYEAQDETELSFEKGQLMLILNQEDAGWWEVQLQDQRKGLIPSNYVEILR